MLVGLAAASKDQAGFVREAIDVLLRLNADLLKPYITVNKHNIRNDSTGSFLRILATDGKTSMGETPDFVIVDELTHWENEEFWTAIFSAVPKRPKSFISVISNAGLEMGESWQWKVREQLRQSPRAYFQRLDGPVASWQKKEDLEDQRKILTQSAFARLFLNEWQMGSGDGLDHNDIVAAVTRKGPADGKEHYHGFFISLDLGIRRDHAAVLAEAVQAVEDQDPRVRQETLVKHRQAGAEADRRGGHGHVRGRALHRLNRRMIRR